MIITELPNLTRARACIIESIQGAVTAREGALHSPYGTVEVLSLSYYMPLARQVSTQCTRLRMVYDGCGWEYADDSFYEPDLLSGLAADFARRVADKAIGRKQQPLALGVSSGITSPIAVQQ